MKSALLIIALVLLTHMIDGRSVSTEKFRMYRASLRVAKRLCKQSANSDTKVCKEFLSLVSDTTKNANGGSDNEDEGTTPSLGVHENSEGQINHMFGNPGLQWGG